MILTYSRTKQHNEGITIFVCGNMCVWQYKRWSLDEVSRSVLETVAYRRILLPDTTALAMYFEYLQQFSEIAKCIIPGLLSG